MGGAWHAAATPAGWVVCCGASETPTETPAERMARGRSNEPPSLLVRVAEAGGFEPPVPRGTLAFKVQRRSAVGRSRAGQRSGVVRARPARRHRVVVSVDVNGSCDGIASRPSRRPARQRARATSSSRSNRPDRRTCPNVQVGALSMSVDVHAAVPMCGAVSRSSTRSHIMERAALPQHRANRATRRGYGRSDPGRCYAVGYAH